MKIRNNVKEILMTSSNSSPAFALNRAGPCIMDMTSILIFHFLHGDMDFKSFLQTKDMSTDDR